MRFQFRTGLFLFVALAEPVAALAGISVADCARAANYSEKKRGVSMLVMQNGRILFQHYVPGAAPDGRWPIFSGTKSFWGIAALCAARDHLINLDDRVADTIKEWKRDPRKSQITIRQLLNFTDGIEGAPHLHRASIRDRDAIAIRLRCIEQPGTAFIYGPSHLQIFVELLRRKLDGRSPISYLQSNVLDPLGLDSLEFKKDARGNPLAASGFELTAEEWARFGELVLHRGDYEGHQIVPSGLLRQALTGSEANPCYGLTFWLNRQAARAAEVDVEKQIDLPWPRAHWASACFSRVAPPDMAVALGSDSQRLFIIPSMNAVIVRQGRGAKFSDARFIGLILGRR